MHPSKWHLMLQSFRGAWWRSPSERIHLGVTCSDGGVPMTWAGQRSTEIMRRFKVMRSDNPGSVNEHLANACCCKICMTHASRSALSYYAAVPFTYIFWSWSSPCERLVTCSYIIPALSSPSLLYTFASESVSDSSTHAHTDFFFCIPRCHKSDKAHRSDECWGELWPFTFFPPTSLTEVEWNYDDTSVALISLLISWCFVFF